MIDEFEIRNDCNFLMRFVKVITSKCMSQLDIEALRTKWLNQLNNIETIKMTDLNAKKLNWKRNYRSLKRQEEREEFANWKEDDFINHIFELREELEALQEKLDSINTSIDVKNNTSSKVNALKMDDFKIEWPYSTKFVFLLSFENKPLTSLEIHKHLLKLDKQYSVYNNPKSTLSVYLRTVTKTGRIMSVKLPGIKEKLFALPQWLNEKGNLDKVYSDLINLFK